MRARQKEKEAQMGVDFNAIRAELAASEEGRGQSALKEAEKQKIQNIELADLNKDGKLSSYEKKRGAAIERAMGVSEAEEGGEEKKEESLEEGDGTICEECGGNGLHEDSCSSHDRKNESLQEEEKTSEEKKKEAARKMKEKYPHLDPDNPKYAGPPAPARNENLQEGWSKKKDQLLFERLVNKWIK